MKKKLFVLFAIINLFLIPKLTFATSSTTYTKHYSLTKPATSPAAKNWGEQVNSNFDTIDSTIYNISTGYFNKSSDDSDDVTQGSSHLFVSSAEKSTWNAKQDALTAGTDYEVPLTFSNSLIRSSNTVALLNDSSSPGNSYYYGTNNIGTKGFHILPSLIAYPTAGIVTSTGSAWGTSITDNSSNWNTAYGWGDHASAGYLKADGSVTGATSSAQTFTNGIVSNIVTGGTLTTSDLYLKTTSGIGTTGADMHFLVGNNGATEAMTILNSGYVGLGSTSPVAKLDIDDNGSYFGVPLSRIDVVDSTFPAMQFALNGTNRMAITLTPNYTVLEETSKHIILSGGTGNIGIGTTLPIAKLHSLSTSEQLRLGYNADNYAPFTVSSSGDLTIAPTGGDVNITGNLSVSTEIISPKLYHAGDITIDAYNASADTNIYLQNSDATHVANVNIDGDLNVRNIEVQEGGVLQLGYDTVDGELRIYSEQGATDYIAHLWANTAMTEAVNIYLPAAMPASTYLLNMTSGG